ncbi:hybrid sensor histidine kinase/response regulator [bacterium]|nr:hybrid sensor histidine kinase/response regulator [bacterium]
MIYSYRKKSKILIVDDVPQNIQVLANILKEEGYQMGFAKDGKTALAHTDSVQFDLIILDIMMPDMDGFEVCERLKKDKKKRDIPVIFVTAKDETSDKTRGFELGAVDYITKPFDAQEVLARIKTHISLRNYTIRLEEMVEERTRQLIHADRLATLGMFSAAVAHEIKNPLSYIMGSAKILQIFWKSAKPVLEKTLIQDEEGKHLKELGNIEEKIDNILHGSNRISRLIDGMKKYSRQGNVIFQDKTPLAEIIKDSLDIVSHRLNPSGIKVNVDIPPYLTIYCDQQKISQVFVNLINNSCDAIAEKGGEIEIKAAAVNNQAEIIFKDDGPGIPSETAEKIFDPFFTTKGKGEGTGLGLFIVSRIIEEHQGKISLSSCNTKGAAFRIVLPLA